MATSKKIPTPVKKAAAPAAKQIKAVKASAASTPAAIKPIKERLTKASLTAHLAQVASVDLKSTRAVLAALEGAILGSITKKGVGEFMLPGLLKISAQTVPATKKRFGKDPFTGEERWFPAKPASVKIKVRALKKLKDAL